MHFVNLLFKHYSNFPTKQSQQKDNDPAKKIQNLIKSKVITKAQFEFAHLHEDNLTSCPLFHSEPTKTFLY